MSLDEALAQAKQILAKICGLKAADIGDDDVLLNLADSLAVIEALVEAQRKFGLNLSEEDENAFPDLKTVRDLAHLLMRFVATPAVA